MEPLWQHMAVRRHQDLIDSRERQDVPPSVVLIARLG